MERIPIRGRARGRRKDIVLPPPEYPEFKMCVYIIRVEPAINDKGTLQRLIDHKRDRLPPHMISGGRLIATRLITDYDLEWQCTLQNQKHQDVKYKVRLIFIRNFESTESPAVQVYNVFVKEMGLKLPSSYYSDPRAGKGRS